MVRTSISPVYRGILKIFFLIEMTEKNITIKLNCPIRMPVDDRVINIIVPIGYLKDLEGQ